MIIHILKLALLVGIIIVNIQNTNYDNNNNNTDNDTNTNTIKKHSRACEVIAGPFAAGGGWRRSLLLLL